VAASRKLKLFGGKISPKKRSTPTVSRTHGAVPSNTDTNIPQNEVVTTKNNKNNKKDTKTLKLKDGVEESRISPEPPT
jgi:hypothetical protein